MWLVILATVPASVLVTFIAFQPWIHPHDLFPDALAVAKAAAKAGEACCPRWFGFVSNLGILLWAGTAAVCFLTSLVLHYVPKRKYHAFFFLSGAILTAWLTLDDMYQIHERNGLDYLVAVYALLVLIYLISFRRVIGESGILLLILSLVLFMMSTLIDYFYPKEDTIIWLTLGEDGSKFVGISLWAAFHLRAAWLNIVADLVRSAPGR